MQPLLLFAMLCVLCAMVQCYPTGDDSYTGVTYDALEYLNASCDPFDTCRMNRSSDTLDPYNCMCGPVCVRLDTCCVDSPFRNTVRIANSSGVRNANSSLGGTIRSAISSFSNTILSSNSAFGNIVRGTTTPSPSNTALKTTTDDSAFSNTIPSTTAKCIEIYGGKTFYMVDTCSPGWSDDGLVEGMCKGNGEDISDPFLTIPVTSLKSGITYKNYFCSVCSSDEQLEDLSFWNIRLTKEDGSVVKEELPEMFYNDTFGSWMMGSGEEDGIEEPVTISIKITPDLSHLVHKCYPDLISTCSADWTDEELAVKCAAYMAKIVFHKKDGGLVRYRNPHCAICNHENVLEQFCFDSLTTTRLKPGGVKDVLFVGLFVIEDTDKKCSKNMVYDVFFKKCRIARCSKGKVFRDGKCVLSDA